MPRANRHYIPGQVWHITRMCHKKEFLLKFARDRQNWLRWLFEAKKRFGLRILNYIITSNHIHLLAVDDGERDVIPRSLQLIAGRTGQEYNQRKGRKGAFWEDRYHATAVESGSHLIQCIVYIDLNMVRTGIIDHPSQWSASGYNEMQNPRQRYTLIDYRRLAHLLGYEGIDDIREAHRVWVEDALKGGKYNVRDYKWTESVAVGSGDFVEKTKEKLGIKIKGRKITENNGVYELKESNTTAYGNDYSNKIDAIRSENTYFWESIPCKSEG